jgi:Type IV secretion-system coupling protein DNA-binding domain
MSNEQMSDESNEQIPPEYDTDSTTYSMTSPSDEVSLSDETSQMLNASRPLKTPHLLKTSNALEAFYVGKILQVEKDSVPLQLVTDDPLLRPYLKTAWLRGFVEERLGISIKPETKSEKAEAKSDNTTSPKLLEGETKLHLPDASLARHIALFGSSGSGKSRLAFHLLQKQLEAGYSAVALDPKPDTIEHLLALAKAAGLRPEQITLLVPTDPENVVGWNPLDYVAFGLPVAQVVGAFVSIIEQGASSWGPRLREVLVNALTVISARRLSLFEVVQFLRREEYRVGLLEEMCRDGYRAYSFEDGIAIRESVEYFQRDFTSWSKGERVAATGPVLNKLSELLRLPFLRAMLCAKESTLDLADCWQEQRFLIVHLDRTVLGDEGVRLLGGLICWQLYQTAMRVEGPVPVILSLDEMGVGVQFIGKAVYEILAIARSRKLRLLLACQFLDQLGDDLRTALISTTGVRVFFRLGYPDAKLVASSLGAGTGESIQKVSLEAGRVDTVAQIPHRIVDEWGRPVALTAVAWEVWKQFVGSSPVADAPVQILLKLAGVSGTSRLYVIAQGEKYTEKEAIKSRKEAVEIRQFLTGIRPYMLPDPLAKEKEEPSIGYWIQGPAPLFLMIRFPRPRLQVMVKQTESERSQHWLRMLQDLPVQQAVFQMAEVSCTAKVLDVPDIDKGDVPKYIEQIRKRTNMCGTARANSREETENWRRGEVDRISQGLPPISQGLPRIDTPRIPLEPLNSPDDLSAPPHDVSSDLPRLPTNREEKEPQESDDKSIW